MRASSCKGIPRRSPRTALLERFKAVSPAGLRRCASVCSSAGLGARWVPLGSVGGTLETLVVRRSTLGSAGCAVASFTAQPDRPDGGGSIGALRCIPAVALTAVDAHGDASFELQIELPTLRPMLPALLMCLPQLSGLAHGRLEVTLVVRWLSSDGEDAPFCCLLDARSCWLQSMRPASE